jgi:hypothetical protein
MKAWMEAPERRRKTTPALRRATAGCPRACRDDERGRRQHLLTELAQVCLPSGIEAHHVAARGPDAEQEPLPPLLERRMVDVDRKGALLDLA